MVLQVLESKNQLDTALRSTEMVSHDRSVVTTGQAAAGEAHVSHLALLLSPAPLSTSTQHAQTFDH